MYDWGRYGRFDGKIGGSCPVPGQRQYSAEQSYLYNHIVVILVEHFIDSRWLLDTPDSVISETISGVKHAEKANEKMAEWDLTSTMGQYLDRHLVFPLLEFLSEKDVCT